VEVTPEHPAYLGGVIDDDERPDVLGDEVLLVAEPVCLHGAVFHHLVHPAHQDSVFRVVHQVVDHQPPSLGEVVHHRGYTDDVAVVALIELLTGEMLVYLHSETLHLVSHPVEGEVIVGFPLPHPSREGEVGAVGVVLHEVEEGKQGFEALGTVPYVFPAGIPVEVEGPVAVPSA